MEDGLQKKIYLQVFDDNLESQSGRTFSGFFQVRVFKFKTLLTLFSIMKSPVMRLWPRLDFATQKDHPRWKLLIKKSTPEGALVSPQLLIQTCQFIELFLFDPGSAILQAEIDGLIRNIPKLVLADGYAPILANDLTFQTFDSIIGRFVGGTAIVKLHNDLSRHSKRIAGYERLNSTTETLQAERCSALPNLRLAPSWNES